MAEVIGIPNMEEMGDLTKLKPGTLATYIVQKHEAARAGIHYDHRIGTPELGLYSWASRTGPSQLNDQDMAGAYPQAVHSWDYKDFSGNIDSGYGAGRVDKVLEQPIVITEQGPGKLLFSTAGKYPQRYVMIQPDPLKPWMIRHGKMPKVHMTQKDKYRDIHRNDAERFLSRLPKGSVVQPKVDGALVFVQSETGRPELVSHRISQKTGLPIVHSEKFFGALGKKDSRWKDTVAKGEIFGERDGVAIHPSELSGILNSNLDKALQAQRDGKVRLKTMLFDVVRYNGQDVSNRPYAERMKLAETLARTNPSKFIVAPTATTREDAVALWRQIREGRYPMTKEGVVVRGPKGELSRIKSFDEDDVFIRGTFPAMPGSKYDKLGIPGGFTYSFEPEGDVVGRVGTGFDDQLRSMLPDLVGRKARIQHIGSSGGALQKPSLLAIHEGWPGPDDLKQEEGEVVPVSAVNSPTVPIVSGIGLDGVREMFGLQKGGGFTAYPDDIPALNPKEWSRSAPNPKGLIHPNSVSTRPLGDLKRIREVQKNPDLIGRPQLAPIVPPKPREDPGRGWNPHPAAQSLLDPKGSFEYLGKYSPIQDKGGYGDKLPQEIEKAKAYGVSRGLGYKYDQLSKLVPVYRTTGGEGYSVKHPVFGAQGVYHPGSILGGAREHISLGDSKANYMIDREFRDRVDPPYLPDPHGPIDLEGPGGVNLPSGVEPQDVPSSSIYTQLPDETLRHELSHAWTEDSSKEKHIPLFEGPDNLGALYSIDRFQFMHGTRPAELTGRLSRLQESLFRQGVGRLENPEQVDSYFSRMSSLSPKEFEGALNSHPDDVRIFLRQMRELNRLKRVYSSEEMYNPSQVEKIQSVFDYLKLHGPALVQNQQPDIGQAKIGQMFGIQKSGEVGAKPMVAQAGSQDADDFFKRVGVSSLSPSVGKPPLLPARSGGVTGYVSASQFKPQYGEKLPLEISKAKAYTARNGLENPPKYDRLDRPVPVQYPRPNSQFSSSLAQPDRGGIEISDDLMSGILEKPRRLNDNNFVRLDNGQLDPQTDQRGVLEHEVSHSWTARPYNPASLTGLGPENVGWHAGNPDELDAWMSRIQPEIYGMRGKRLETPEEAKSFFEGLHSLPVEEFEKEISKYSVDNRRWFRFLRKVNESSEMPWWGKFLNKQDFTGKLQQLPPHAKGDLLNNIYTRLPAYVQNQQSDIGQAKMGDLQIPGVTHTPSGFKMHVPREVVPSTVKRAELPSAPLKQLKGPHLGDLHGIIDTGASVTRRQTWEKLVGPKRTALLDKSSARYRGSNPELGTAFGHLYRPNTLDTQISVRPPKDHEQYLEERNLPFLARQKIINDETSVYFAPGILSNGEVEPNPQISLPSGATLRDLAHEQFHPSSPTIGDSTAFRQAAQEVVDRPNMRLSQSKYWDLGQKTKERYFEDSPLATRGSAVSKSMYPDAELEIPREEFTPQIGTLRMHLETMGVDTTNPEEIRKALTQPENYLKYRGPDGRGYENPDIKNLLKKYPVFSGGQPRPDFWDKNREEAVDLISRLMPGIVQNQSTPKNLNEVRQALSQQKVGSASDVLVPTVGGAAIGAGVAAALTAVGEALHRQEVKDDPRIEKEEPKWVRNLAIGAGIGGFYGYMGGLIGETSTGPGSGRNPHPDPTRYDSPGGFFAKGVKEPGNLNKFTSASRSAEELKALKRMATAKGIEVNLPPEFKPTAILDDPREIGSSKPSIGAGVIREIAPISGFDYSGHFTPAQVRAPYYGGDEVLKKEVEKAQAYAKENRLPVKYDPLWDKIPVFTAKDPDNIPTVGGKNIGSGLIPDVNILGLKIPKFLRLGNEGANPDDSTGKSLELRGNAIIPEDYPLFYRVDWENSGFGFSPDGTLRHELGHGWTIPTVRKMFGFFGANKPMVPGDSFVHGARPTEIVNWLSQIQGELFKNTGKRLESAEEVRAFFRGIIDIKDDSEFEKALSPFSWDARRFFRHLRHLETEGNDEDRRKIWGLMGKLTPALVNNLEKEMGDIGKMAAYKSPTVRSLLKAKKHSDKKDYRTKHQIVRKLMTTSPNDFVIDSEPTPGIAGITHSPSGFKMHVPREVVPEGVKRADVVVSGKPNDFSVNSEALDRQRARVHTSPSPAQAEAGNYRKGHVRVQGLDITIECPKGSYREGVARDGTKWQTKLGTDYGYIKGTVSGADDDHIDTLLGSDLDSEVVYVIDQYIDGKFDEHKTAIGFKSSLAAKEGYLSNYVVGWKGFGGITPLTMQEFKWWIMNGNSSKPMKDQRTAKFAEDAYLEWIGIDLEVMTKAAEDPHRFFDVQGKRLVVGPETIKKIPSPIQDFGDRSVEIRSHGLNGEIKSLIGGPSLSNTSLSRRSGALSLVKPLSGERLTYIDAGNQSRELPRVFPIGPEEFYSNVREGMFRRTFDSAWEKAKSTPPEGASDLYQRLSRAGRDAETVISYACNNVGSPLCQLQFRPGASHGITVDPLTPSFYEEMFPKAKRVVMIPGGFRGGQWSGYTSKINPLVNAFLKPKEQVAPLHVFEKENGTWADRGEYKTRLDQWLEGKGKTVVTGLGTVRDRLSSAATGLLSRINKKEGEFVDGGIEFLFVAKTAEEAKEWGRFIGVDLDGTLAESEGEFDPHSVGEPIPSVMKLVKGWISNGETVKIFTARAADPDNIPVIKAWAKKHGLGDIEVTNIKDPGMILLLDDRAIQVAKNEGLSVEQIEEAKDFVKGAGVYSGRLNPGKLTIKLEGDDWNIYDENNESVGKTATTAVPLATCVGHLDHPGGVRIRGLSDLVHRDFNPKAASRHLRQPIEPRVKFVAPDSGEIDVGNLTEKVAADMQGIMPLRVLTDEEKLELVDHQLRRSLIDPEISERTLGAPIGHLGRDAFLSTSKKLLAINRGEAKPDDRDHKANQTYHSVEDFMAERVTKDVDGVGRTLLMRVRYNGTLDPLRPGLFTKQLENLIVSNSLSQAVPGINPIELVDIQQKITQVGEGGIGDKNTVPLEARNVHPSQLGVVDPIRTAESGAVGIDQRLSSFARKGPNQQLYMPLIDRKTGKRVWRTPSQLYGKTILFPAQTNI